MCFETEGYDWYADSFSVVDSIGQHCDECGQKIPNGDLVFVASSSEDDCDDDEEEPPVDRDFFTCGPCELTRFLVELHERDEGCDPGESKCPYGLLIDHLIESKSDLITPHSSGPRVTVASQEDGQAFLAWRKDYYTKRREKSCASIVD